MIDEVYIPYYLSLGLEATGEWRKSVNAKGSSIYGKGYSEQLVFGRKPGLPPPIAPLIKWAEAILGLSGQAAISAAWAVRKKIEKEGTEIFKKGGTDLVEFLYSQQVLDYLSLRLGEVIKQQVTTDLQRIVNEV